MFTKYLKFLTFIAITSVSVLLFKFNQTKNTITGFSKLKQYIYVLNSLNTQFAFADLYEFEFIEEKIHRPCPKFPDNFVNEFFDFDNLNIEQTDEGTLIMDGYAVLKKSYDKVQPVSLEMFKKERGTYQPTIINIKRADFCLMLFDSNEVFFDYLKQTPLDQFICPLFEGQQISVTVSEAVYINLPTHNAEGEYLMHAEVGNNTDMTSFFCTEIPAYLHKV